MKFDVKNWCTGAVSFTAEIDCKKEDSNSWKLRLAVQWAIENNANLSNANLRCADLSYANLSYANLSCADLSCANLRYASLSCATLSNANLSYANLSNANLSYANLSNANLRCADLSCANLRYANLSYASLSCATLSNANLRCADLSNAAIKAVSFTGVGKENRAGYAIIDGKEIKVHLGCFYDTEKVALAAIKKKYGRGSAYEMIVKGACKQLKEKVG